MDDSSEYELPDLSIKKLPIPTYTITRVDVDKEIQESIARKERQESIDELNRKAEECEKQEIETFEVPPTPRPEICSLPPDRKIFYPERSQRAFNYTTLTTENIGSSHYSTCSLDNVDELFCWIRSKVNGANEVSKRRLFQYVWLLMSCHPEPLIVQKSCDMLLEFHNSWKLAYQEVILVFFNWGVRPVDFVVDLPLGEINSSLSASPLAPAFNVENTLMILNYKLSDNNFCGSDVEAKTVFVLLLLLSLDGDYRQCLSEIYACLESIATYANSKDSGWVEDYCEAIFKAELHHAQLAFLIECIVPKPMRWCMCLSLCQHMFSLERSFHAEPQPHLLYHVLQNNFEKFLKLGAWELYSVVSIVNVAIFHTKADVTDDIKRGLLNWLNHYMERRPERRKEYIDLDATSIDELVSRLQAEWESMWPGMHTEHVNEIESMEELSDESKRE